MNKVIRYTKYLDFNEAWLGELPSHWEVRRTKLLFNLITEPAPVGNSEELLSVYTALGVKPRKQLEARGNKASTTDNYWKVKQADIIVNKLLAWMGAIGISEYNGVTSPAYDILRAKEHLNPYYYNYLFRNPIASREFKRHSRGIMDMRLRLYFTRFGNIKLPLPPVAEQNKIVSYLNFRLLKIDRFIKKKKKIINLLIEQKATIINKAVTQGLEDKTKQKDSQLKWLPKVPSHWQIKPLKYFVSYNDETLNDKTDANFELKYIDIGNVDKDGNVAEIVRYKFKDAPSRAKRIVRQGDIIVSTVRTYLKAITQIKGETENLIVSTGFIVLRPKETILSDYLNYAVRANYFIETICSNSYGVSYPAINASDLVQIKIAVPDVNEQERILNFLDKELKLLNETISKIRKEIALTEEYKTSIIAEAVTGKIDVREYTFSIIDEVETYEELEEELSIAAEDEPEFNKQEME